MFLRYYSNYYTCCHILRYCNHIFSQINYQAAAHTGYLFTHNMTVVFFLMFIIAQTDTFHLFGQKHVELYFAISPAIGYAIILAINLYTGMIFKAYTYGTGSPVATGGRYDSLLVQFGKDAPATGFAIYLDDLLTAMHRQNIPVDTGRKPALIAYAPDCLESAVREAQSRRKDGARAALVRIPAEGSREEVLRYAREAGMDRVTFLTRAGEKTVRLENPAADVSAAGQAAGADAAEKGEKG